MKKNPQRFGCATQPFFPFSSTRTSNSELEIPSISHLLYEATTTKGETNSEFGVKLQDVRVEGFKMLKEAEIQIKLSEKKNKPNDSDGEVVRIEKGVDETRKMAKK